MTNSDFATTCSYVGSSLAYAPLVVDGDMFSYDANGNMKIGLGGKQMEYDGENRPLKAEIFDQNTGALLTCTKYTYGPDGKRLIKEEKAHTVSSETTVYVGGLEIREDGTQLLYARDFVRSWHNLEEVTVAGTHFIQEDSPDEIGQAIVNWLPKLD
ncbi:MAG: hypothetical protein ABJL99_27305 [Aliishimia sp.]